MLFKLRLHEALPVFSMLSLILLKKTINTLLSAGALVVVENPIINLSAPNAEFFLSNGSLTSLSAYKGHMVSLWFVATWCSGCAQGNEVLNSSYSSLGQKGVKVIELELYNDLGYSGPPIAEFVSSYAPAAYSGGAVTPAYASYNMALTYDPKGYLDIYYLLSPGGKILYTNSPLATTLSQLAAAINSSR
ncbi:MAG: redoxin domain-containing protein [Candidatus Micrarchaeia archaeon]